MENKPGSYKYVYSPVVFGASLVVFAYVFFHAAELPGILIGLVLAAVYIDPRWPKTPDYVHNILMAGGFAVFAVSSLWLFRDVIFSFGSHLLVKKDEK